MLRKLLIITCLLGTVGISFAQKKKKHKDTETAEATTTDTVKINYKEIGAPMPNINMKQVKGKLVTDKYLTSKDLKNDANLFVMMFNPTCSHCQDETEVLKKNIALFKKSKIVLMATGAMETYMEYFENITKISEYPSILEVLDNEKCDFINKTFTYQSLPQINIYDKDRKLIKMFFSETPIDSLKPYIE
ncbi:MAG: hypothetical protein JST82_15150 [Bacteroidetes bacterium]|nr:hypothetical protein [Bacteroidota bacterium]